MDLLIMNEGKCLYYTEVAILLLNYQLGIRQNLVLNIALEILLMLVDLDLEIVEKLF